jgi:hypothetical protein
MRIKTSNPTAPNTGIAAVGVVAVVAAAEAGCAGEDTMASGGTES